MPRERLQPKFAGPLAIDQLGMDLTKRNAATGGIFLIHAPGKHRRPALEAGMVKQEARQLRARVPGNSNNCCLDGLAHDSRIFLSRSCTSLAWRWSWQMTRTVSSPAMVPTTSGHAS